jgi:hypothetical protein
MALSAADFPNTPHHDAQNKKQIMQMQMRGGKADNLTHGKKK